ncbi:MAG: glutathione S-transferase N-terminal domain-containing protein [Pseudomonadota bacterium]
MPPSDLRVLGRADSSNVQAVMWGAAELGLSPTREDYGHRFGGLDTLEYGSLNPHRRVPTLIDGETVVWESCAILRYLASAYGDGGPFWPSDPADRAKVDMWAEWAKHALAVAFTGPIFWSRVRTAAGDRDEAALVRAIAQFEASLNTLAPYTIKAQWILGPNLTLADIVAGHSLYRYFTIDIPRNPPPLIEAYYDRLTNRPAYAEHVMVSYAALAHPEA